MNSPLALLRGIIARYAPCNLDLAPPIMLYFYYVFDILLRCGLFFVL